MSVQKDGDIDPNMQVRLNGYDNLIANALMDLVEYHAKGREELTDLVQQSPWLNSFTSVEQSDFKKAEDAFTADGGLFLTTLQTFVDLYRKELASRALANSHLNVYYAVFCAEALQLCEFKAQNKDCFCEAVATIFGRRAMSNSQKDPKDSSDLSSHQVDEQWRSLEEWSVGKYVPDLIRESIKKTTVFQKTESNAPKPNSLMRLDDAEIFEAIYQTDKICSSLPFRPRYTMLEYLQQAYSENRPDATDTFFWTWRLYQTVGSYALPNSPKPGISTSWDRFVANVRNFVHLVCGWRLPRDAFSIDDILLELHNLNLSRMQYVSTMQKTMREQREEIDRQREVISALMFRHLLEHLPGEEYKDLKLTEAWIEFWKDSMRKLGVVDKDEQDESPEDDGIEFGFDPAEEDDQNTRSKSTSSSRDASTQDSSGTDDEKEKPALEAIAQSRMKASAFQRGKFLYGELSTVIHEYQGGKYKVDKTNWGPIGREILEAMIPLHFDKDGQVDWDKERERYPRD